MVYASSDPTYHAIAGAVSGGLTRFICQPLDVVKIRFQLQVEPIKKEYTSKYHSLPQTFKLIYKEEGIFALWKGHVPAQLLSIFFGTTQFYMYIIFNQHCETYNFFKNRKKTVHFVSGAAAGCVATITTFPLDTIRTRLVAQSSQFIAYKGTIDSCKSIYKTESFKGYFRGLFPTLLQIGPLMGIQFETYEFIKDIKFLPHNEDPAHHKRVGIINSLVAGCIAGLVAKTVVYPFDLARKRLQIQGFEHGRKGFGDFFRCTGLINCLVVTAQKEGILGLFKGLGPSQFKAALTTAFHFTFYEQTLNIIRSVTKKEE